MTERATHATIGDVIVRGNGDYTALAMLIWPETATPAEPKATLAHILTPVGDGQFLGTCSDPLSGYVRYHNEDTLHSWAIPEGWSLVTEHWWERFRSAPLDTTPIPEED